LAILTDYLAPESLQRLEDEFAAALRIPVRICAVDGRPLTEESVVWREPGEDAAAPADEDAGCGPVGWADVPITLDGDLLGRILVRPPGTAEGEAPPESPPPMSPRARRLLRLMANVIARRWNRQKLLRTRITELATMYRLTAEFAGKRDLQSLLDLVARTVVEILGAKACSIRLLNEEGTELVIKAVANLSPEYLRKGPILLSESKIDQEVVSESKAIYIADERMDPRVLYPAEAQREGLVSALCAPLSYKGHCAGVLHVYMAEVHEFDWYERSLLSAIAAQAAAAIVNARLYEEAVRAANLRRHLRLAGEVQRRMIPARPPELPGLDIAGMYVPCFELGGDFYDFLPLAADNLGVAVCDVVGKGVRASLLMASIRAALRAHAENIYDMSKVMSKVNVSLCADTAISDFATMFYGVIDARGRRFTYANAGHTPPVLVRDGQCCHLTTGGGVLGIDPAFTWRQERMTFQSGDAIVLFTDGVTETLNFRDEPFGRARVDAVVQAAVRQKLTADGVVKHVLWEMRRFAGLQTRVDDLTLIAIRVL
jgi:sigma-B regulation protein RsbU (phosphoserine phosphatase)